MCCLLSRCPIIPPLSIPLGLQLSSCQGNILVQSGRLVTVYWEPGRWGTILTHMLYNNTGQLFSMVRLLG